jgi:hypothetical protein
MSRIARKHPLAGLLAVALAAVVLARCGGVSNGSGVSDGSGGSGGEKYVGCDAVKIFDVRLQLFDAARCAPVSGAKVVLSNGSESFEMFGVEGVYMGDVTIEGCYSLTASAPGHVDRELGDILVKRDETDGCDYGAGNQVTMLLTPTGPEPDAGTPPTCEDAIAQRCN